MLGTRRLQVLVALADAGSIAGAAAALGCTAAAASQQLAALEQESRAQLLERSARSVRLTAAGELLVERARGILADLAAAENEVTSAGGGRLRVASFATAARQLVIPALASLRRRRPALGMTFAELEPEDAVPAVRAGEIDVAVIHRYHPLALPQSRGLRRVELYTDPLLLAVPAAIRQTARIGDLAGADWVSTYPGHGWQALTEITTRLAGFEPKITCRAAGYPVVQALVAAGLGVALVPESAATPQAGLRLLPVDDPPGLARTVEAIARTADRSTAVTDLQRELRRRSDRDRGVSRSG